MQTKVTAGKTLKRAGATLLFRLRAAQKVIGVTPARFGQIMTKHQPRCRSCYLDRSARLESEQVLAEDGCNQIISAFLRHKYLSKRRIDEQRGLSFCVFIRRPSSVWHEIGGFQGIFGLVDGFFMHRSWTVGCEQS
jgi:hypothetical protein